MLVDKDSLEALPLQPCLELANDLLKQLHGAIIDELLLCSLHLQSHLHVMMQAQVVVKNARAIATR